MSSKDPHIFPSNAGTVQRPQLPEPSLRRLPWYLAYVRTLAARGVDCVSSTRISRDLGVAATRIAKDLSLLNIKGKTRIGYNVAELERALTDFLGFTTSHRAMIIGVGSLGGALLRDTGLAQYGLEIVAGFDVKPELVGTRMFDVPVYHISEMDHVRHLTDAQVAILTVPYQISQQMADRAVASGCRAVWNFTPVRIQVPPGIAIANTSIYAHLALIYNRMMAGGAVEADDIT